MINCQKKKIQKKKKNLLRNLLGRRSGWIITTRKKALALLLLQTLHFVIINTRFFPGQIELQIHSFRKPSLPHHLTSFTPSRQPQPELRRLQVQVGLFPLLAVHGCHFPGNFHGYYLTFYRYFRALYKEQQSEIELERKLMRESSFEEEEEDDNIMVEEEEGAGC